MSFGKKACNEIRKIKRGGGAGYTEPGKVVTWDGNMDTATIVDDEVVLVSSEVYDLNAVTRIVLSNDDGEQLEFTPDDSDRWTIQKGDGMQVICIDEIPFVGAMDGIGVVATPPRASVFVSRIEFAETVHTIDPKFLPEISVDTESLASKEYVDQVITGAMEASY